MTWLPLSLSSYWPLFFFFISLLFLFNVGRYNQGKISGNHYWLPHHFTSSYLNPPLLRFHFNIRQMASPPCPHGRSLGAGYTDVMAKSCDDFEVIFLLNSLPLNHTHLKYFMAPLFFCNKAWTTYHGTHGPHLCVSLHIFLSRSFSISALHLLLSALYSRLLCPIF